MARIGRPLWLRVPIIPGVNDADDELRAVALLRMEGHSVEEIAARLGFVERSIKRKMRLIRDVWERELE